ncbi:DUF3302 domain-containing protein [Shewanella psychrotolerans]
MEHFALCVMIFVAIFLFFLGRVIHDIPYEIAIKRPHP